jgi:pimeloyl-ACP methyl ester carboxylesterase
MPAIELSAGRVEYEEAGSGDPLVFLHGFLMDRSLWRNVLPELETGHRCIAPTLPLGAHRHPMRPEADLSLRGQVAIVIELLERLEASDVTLVAIDTGTGLAQLVVQERPELVARLVLLSGEAFDNYPPGLPGHLAWLAGQLPGGIFAALQTLRLRPLRRLPLTFGWMSKRPVPDEVVDGWLRPSLTDAAIRRDARKYVRGARRDRPLVRSASEHMAHFDRPVLVVWATEDRVFPVADGRRLAETIPNATLVELDDSYALLPEDRPAELCRQVRRFLATATV